MNFLKKLLGEKPQPDRTSHVYADPASILPFMNHVNVSGYPDDSFIFNPAGNEKLLRKLAEDLACVFVAETPDGPQIIDKVFLKHEGWQPETIEKYAVQNLTRLFNDKGNLHQKRMDDTSILYRLVLDNRNEASCLLVKDLWEVLCRQHKDNLFAAVPTTHELHFCKVKEGNGLLHLIELTQHAYNAAETGKLSPYVYMFHNGGWKMFRNDPMEVLNYCLDNGLIDASLPGL